MAMLLKGAEVAKALTEELHARSEELKKNGTEPCLAILRVGAREDDLAYERGALGRCEKVGVAVRQVEILHVHALVFNAQTIQLLTDIIAQLSAHARYQYLHSACPRFPYIFS